MKRRRFLGGLGAVTVGASGAIGSGAMSQVTADREFEVAIVSDENAYLRLVHTSELATHTTDTEVLRVRLTDLNEYADGEGFNPRSVYEVEDLDAHGGGSIFEIRNQGDRPVDVMAETLSEDGPTIELYDFEDEDKTAIDDENPYTLQAGDLVAVGIRVIVPEDVEIREYEQQVLIRTEET